MTISFGDVPTVIVAKQQDLDVSRSWHEPRLLPQGYVVVPVDQDDQDACSGHLVVLPDAQQLDVFHSSPWMDFMLICATVGVHRRAQHMALAFLRPWPDHQAAILWTGEDREAFVGKEQDGDRSDWPMNKALRGLGVDATGHEDELSALGLDRLDWGAWPKVTASWLGREDQTGLRSVGRDRDRFS